MSWAKYAIGSLRQGKTVKVKPHGNSMRGKVNDGDTVTLKPVDPEQLAVGDIVLVHVKGNDYLWRDENKILYAFERMKGCL